MTLSLSKALALGGLCALVLGGGSAVSAQGYDHYNYHHHYGHGAGRARRHLQVLHAVYNHEIKSGHPEAAMEAHLHAKAIRAHIRARHHDGY